MSPSPIARAISSSVTGHRLLDHPYYRAWQDGELLTTDLKSYAEQYRSFERSLPEVLSEVAAGMGPGNARRLVEANLRDEMSNPRPHLEMFDDFGGAVGADEHADPAPATSALIGLYRDAAAGGPASLLSVVAAYESQAAEIAATKAAALARHYDLGGTGIEFWTVHAEIEHQHSAWSVDALEAIDASPVEVAHWASRSAAAWWRFLDEREAARAA